MSVLKKGKKGLASILGMFSKAYKELEEWEELTAEEQREVESRLKVIKAERIQAEKAKEALKAFITIK